jgi:hypothetical protein
VAEADRLRGYARPDPPGSDLPAPTSDLPAPTRSAASRSAASPPGASASGASRAAAAKSGSGSGPTRRAEPGATRWTGRVLPAIVAVLSLAVVVGFGVAAARRLAGPQLVPGSPAPAGGALGSSRPAVTGTPSPSPSRGQVTVQLAPSLRDAPNATAVVALFRKYFQAINDRGYYSWVATLSSDRPHESQAEFQEQYSTTVDDDIRVVGITQREDGSLLVAVSFRSRQDSRYAPPDQPVDCLRWQIFYPLTIEDGRLKIAKVEFINRTYRPCSDNLTRPG